MPELAQTSFAGGELTPDLHARVDLARYYTALKTCRNFIVRPTGGVVNRPGTVFVASAKYPDRVCRLIEFKFNSAQTYVLEFGHLYLRIFYRGAPVVYPVGHEDAGQVVEVATIWTEAQLAELSYTQNADVMTICHEECKQQQIGRFAHADWRISDFVAVGGPFLDSNTDRTKSLFSNDVTGTIDLTAAADIFTAEHVGRLMRIEQNPDDWTDRWEVQKATAAGSKVKAGSSFYVAAIPGTTGTFRPSATEGTESDGTRGVMWRYLHSGFGIVRILSVVDAQHATAEVISTLPDSVVGSEEDPITAWVWDADQKAADGVTEVYWIRGCPAYAVGTLVTIKADSPIAGTYYVLSSGVDTGEPFIGIPKRFAANYGTYPLVGATISLGSGGQTYKWAFQAWGGEQGFPATSGYYQQRQIFGGTPGRPHEIQMSRSAGYLDFGQSNPLLDDDSITFSLNSGGVGQIIHFVALKQLVALTTEGPWIVSKEQGNPIPATDPQGEGGASRVPPLKIGRQALYVEAAGSIIRALGYEFSSDAYEGKDLTILADHLFGEYRERRVVSWAYQKTPFRCVWVVLDNGVLLGLTYLPEQEVIAWHRHDTEGAYESVCCIAEDGLDAVYVSVRRSIGGVDNRYIERFASRNFPTQSDVFVVDSGLTYDGRGAGDGIAWTISDGDEWTYQETLTFTTDGAFFSGASDEGDVIVVRDAEGAALRLTIINYIAPDAVTVIASRTIPAELRDTPAEGFDLARNVLTGLEHLEGKTVSILSDGNVSPRQVVAGGSVTLPRPGVVVHVGLQIIADLETLEINAQGQSSQDRVKNINSVSLMVRNTRGLLAGPDADHLLEARAEISGNFETFYNQKTGVLSINIISDWSKGGRVFIRQEDPLAANILAIIPQVVTGGS